MQTSFRSAQRVPATGPNGVRRAPRSVNAVVGIEIVNRIVPKD